MNTFFPLMRQYPNYQVSFYGQVKDITTGEILRQRKSGHGYLYVQLFHNEVQKTVAVHRLVCGLLPNPESKPQVDHIDQDRTNNNILNLRWVTRQQNSLNRRTRTDNSSGITGVVFCKRTNKWRANISIDRKLKTVGYYKTIEEATVARRNAEKQHYGEYMNNN